MVDDHFQVVRLYGDTSALLHFKAGAPTLNLLDLLPPQLASGVHLAVRDAQAQQRSLSAEGFADPATGELTVSIRVTPLPAPTEEGAKLLITFLRDADSTAARHGPADAVSWSEALRISNAELEASREELQALNEELRASNEQLNRSNEELNDSNAQLQEKVKALETQSNVLSSGEVITVFIDGELKVRFFTPGVNALFPMRAGDIGREITDLSPRFELPRFLERVKQVMATRELSEAEVHTRDGRWYLMRIRPFHTGIGKTAGPGVAINFVDVTDRKAIEQALRRKDALMTAQKEAFEAAMNGAPLEASLAILARAAAEHCETQVQCTFFLGDGDGEHQPLERGSRSWSFPIETASGQRVGSFAMVLTPSAEPTEADRELAATLCQTAAIIISRHQPVRPG